MEQILKNFYITFGPGGLFHGGWVIVKALNEGEARDRFAEYYGDRAYNRYGFLNFCTSYDEERFLATGMELTGNCGAFCHEVIE